MEAGGLDSRVKPENDTQLDIFSYFVMPNAMGMMDGELVGATLVVALGPDESG